MAKKKEGTLKFLKEFKDAHNNGMSLIDFAELCNISSRHAYFLTHEISRASGIPREELLDAPHKQHVWRFGSSHASKSVQDVNFDDLVDRLVDANIRIEALQKKINERRFFE